MRKTTGEGAVTDKSALQETEARWFAIRTRSKCEKVVCQALAKKNIHAYLPLLRSVRRYERKVKQVEKPLITCYVFVRIVRPEYVPVLETEHVAGFVKTAQALTPIPEEEINILRRVVLEPGLELEAIPGAIGTGDAVEIIGGPLTGLQGCIVKTENKRKMQVELRNLGYSLLITIDSALLQKR